MRPDRERERYKDGEIVENEHKYKLHISHTFCVAHNAQRERKGEIERERTIEMSRAFAFKNNNNIKK